MIFRVQEEEYAIPVALTGKIIGYRPTTKLPATPDYVEGIINLKGKVIPIIRLSVKFGLAGDKPEDRQIIILKVGTQEIGIVVDKVTGVRQLVATSIEPVSGACSEPGSWIRAIGKVDDRLVVLLDGSRLFSDDELTVIQLIQAQGERGHDSLVPFDQLGRANKGLSQRPDLYKKKLQQLILSSK